MAQTQDGIREASARSEAELRGNYQIDSIRLPEMNGRLQGSFQVTGDLTPRKLVGKETATNPEETATAFLEESKTLFGAADFTNDLRRKSALKDRHGATPISYHRQIGGLPLEGAEVTPHINSKGQIFAVTGRLTSGIGGLRC
jgi:Zn-dependent metalloprotease